MKALKFLITGLLIVCSLASFGWDPPFKPGNNGVPHVGPNVGPNVGPHVGPKPPIRWDKPPIFNLGDWNSAGAPMPPYNPPYPFSYKCQAQLSDQLRREGPNGKYYQYFAIAEFQLTEKKWQVQSEELKWFGKKLYSFDQIPDTNDPIPFSTEGSSIRIMAYQGYPGYPERVELAIELEQKINGLIISDRSKESTLRSSSGLSASVYLNLRSESQEEIPRMMMRVLCSKEK